jgi:KAP-like P-loop domain-containing protein
MAEPIPIIADVPQSNPGLGFDEYARALADAVRGGSPAQFTIGIYGPWGSGKSSLLKAIANDLDEDDSVVPILFDAWRYERSGNVLLPLLHQMYAKISELGDQSLANRVGSALRSIIYSLKFNLAIVEVDLSKMKPTEDPSQALHQLDEAFSRPFEEMRALSRALSGRRVAVLIDDLDRCSPSNVVSVLEAINLIMDVPGFVFVLALDYEVLVQAVNHKYPHVSGHAFIEKIVQLPFRVPRLDLRADSFLEDLLPNWRELRRHFPSGFAKYSYDIVSTGLEANPRQVKRLLNSFQVLQRIVQRGSDADYETLCALIGLQLRWPEYYRDFAQAVTANDEAPHSVLESGEESDLLRYSHRFFHDVPSTEVLRQFLMLAATVVSPEQDAGVQPEMPTSMREVREENRDEMMSYLGSRAFQSVPRSQGLYKHEGLPDFRVRLGKTVIRVEMRLDPLNDPYRWTLKRSYLLTREVGNAMEYLNDLLTGVEFRETLHKPSRNL